MLNLTLVPCFLRVPGMRKPIICGLGLIIMGLGLNAFADDPKELVDLRKVQAEIIQRATAAANTKLQTTLKQMVEDYTKAGKLEAATVAKRDLAATWAAGMWYVLKNGKPAEWLTVYPDGFACTAGIVPGKWAPEGDGIKITWSNGFTWTMEQPRAQDMPSGKESAGTKLKFSPTKPAGA